MKTDEEVIAAIEPYARLVGGFFNELTTEEVATFRRRYGTGAPAEIAYSIGRVIRESQPDFEPEGLLDWIETKSRVDVVEAQRLCTDIERRLISSIVDRMKEEYGEDGWWRAVPLSVRREAAARREEEPEDHPLETFLQLIDLRTIIQSEWQLFQHTHGMGKGSKADRTDWLVKLNDVRRRTAHAGGARLKLDDMDLLKEIDAALTNQGI